MRELIKSDCFWGLEPSPEACFARLVWYECDSLFFRLRRNDGLRELFVNNSPAYNFALFFISSKNGFHKKIFIKKRIISLEDSRAQIKSFLESFGNSLQNVQFFNFYLFNEVAKEESNCTGYETDFFTSFYFNKAAPQSTFEPNFYKVYQAKLFF